MVEKSNVIVTVLERFDLALNKTIHLFQKKADVLGDIEIHSSACLVVITRFTLLTIIGKHKRDTEVTGVANYIRNRRLHRRLRHRHRSRLRRHLKMEVSSRRHW